MKKLIGLKNRSVTTSNDTTKYQHSEASSVTWVTNARLVHVLAENAHLTYKFLSAEVYEFLDATLMVQVSAHAPPHPPRPAASPARSPRALAYLARISRRRRRRRRIASSTSSRRSTSTGYAH